jgi:hypothetical protein
VIGQAFLRRIHSLSVGCARAFRSLWSTKRLTLANAEDTTFRRSGQSSLASLPGSKLSILKWLPANRAAISFLAAVNDKTRDLVLDQHAVLRSMMGTRRQAGLWIRGGFSREDRNPLATDRRRDAVTRLRPLAARASCRKGAIAARLSERLDGVSPKPDTISAGDNSKAGFSGADENAQ